jgi:hypothetical protein
MAQRFADHEECLLHVDSWFDAMNRFKKLGLLYPNRPGLDRGIGTAARAGRHLEKSKKLLQIHQKVVKKSP